MTTIVYYDGVMAYESRITEGNMICDDNHNKRIVKEGVEFYVCGAISDVEHLIHCFINSMVGPVSQGLNAAAIAWDGADVWTCGFDEGEFWRLKHKKEIPAAMGSGRQFALGAIAMGADAVQAVKVACKLDAGSGGKIRKRVLE